MLRFYSPLHRQLEPELQNIEVWSTMAIPSFRVVGLPGREIIESCERVRAAIEASGIEFPRKRVLVNLSPAGIRKQGTGTDLAIALAVISPSQLPQNESAPERRIVASGELALDGVVRPAGRVLRALTAAVRAHAHDLILSIEEQDIAANALQLLRKTGGVQPNSLPRVHLVRTLSDVVGLLTRNDSPSLPLPPEDSEKSLKFPDVLPLATDLQRTLMASAAGAHHLLLIGPKGSGKTATLRWLYALQAPLSAEELLERLLLEELTTGGTTSFDQQAPIRTVPPQIRPEALVGGLYRGELRPGEFSQAHGGTLIADEFLEWPRDARESLRDPMETGVVQLVRSQQSIELPARFQLAATANLCRCGGWPQAWRTLKNNAQSKTMNSCRCSEHSRKEYLSRLSGPILDRIDIVRLVYENPAANDSSRNPPSPRCLAELTERTRSMLASQWGKPPGKLSATELETILKAEPQIAEGWSRIRRAQEVSLRRRHKEIRVALTLAALDSASQLHSSPLPECRHYREATDGSAETWLRSLSETRVRDRKSAVDQAPINS